MYESCFIYTFTRAFLISKFFALFEFKGSVSDKLYRPFSQKMHFFEILTTLQGTGMHETQHIIYQTKDNFIEN